MKKVLLVIFVLLLVALSLPTAILAEGSSDYKSSETYLLLEEFVTTHPDRSSTETEKTTANYLINKFSSFGYATQLQKIPYDIYGYETYNAIGFLDSTLSSECIVIGAHYDSIGEGANDNASGVVALLQIAKQLANQNAIYPFDIYVVAFGGEEQGLFGSQYFVDQFSQNYKMPLSNILVMFNVDSVANGDNLYLHCENKSTALADLILQNSSGKVALTEKPYAVGTYNADAWGYGYYETVQGSDHTPFRMAGVPVANFFSGNFLNWDFVESKDAKNNTMNSVLDKLENCNQGWIDKIDTVVATIVATVTNDSFADVGKNARDQLLNLDFWYNRLWPKIVVVAFVIVLIVLAVLHNRKLQKQALMGSAEARTTRIFETPNADDIFTFKD